MELQARAAMQSDQLNPLELGRSGRRAMPQPSARYPAQVEPWRRLAGDGQSGYQRRLLGLPRLTKAAAASAALWRALAAGAGCAWLGYALVNSIYAGWTRQTWESGYGPVTLMSAPLETAQAVCLVLLAYTLLVLALFVVPRVVFLAMRNSWVRRWEQSYTEAYLALRESGIAALIVDEDFWRTALGAAPVSAVLKLVGQGAPQTTAEVVRLTAAFWPYLLRYQRGEREALAAGIYDGFGKFAAAGKELSLKNPADQLDLRARAAALTDFLFDPPLVEQ